jgi:hypothetical protein
MRRELFHPTDKDNKDSTPLLENLTAIAAQAWIDELLDPKEQHSNTCLSLDQITAGANVWMKSKLH